MILYQGDNIGGIAYLDLAFHTDFESFNPAVLLAGRSWIEIGFKEETANLELSESESENGTIYSYSGKFFLQRLRPELENVLRPFIGQLSVMRITDMNGEVYIIGAPGSPVDLVLSGNTGSGYPNENGASYSFSVDQAFPFFRN